MPQKPSYTGDEASGDEQIQYPIDLMCSVASKVLAETSLALDQYDAHWKQVQTYLHTLPGVLQGPFKDLLTQHEQRLRASYQWQIDFASALFSAIDAIEGTDEDVSQQFAQKNTGHGYPVF